MSNPYFSAELGETYHIKLDSAFTTVSEQIAAAGPGTAWVLPPRTTANILAYATPVVGMLCQASDTGYWWAYYDGVWAQQPSNANTIYAPRPIPLWQADSVAPFEALAADDNALGQPILYAVPAAMSWVRCRYPVLVAGKDHNFVVRVAMSTSDTDDPTVVAAYHVAAATGALGLPLTRWKASTAYTTEKRLPTIPVSPGKYFECTTAGTSHATTEPSIAGAVGSTVSDGTATWTIRAGGLTLISNGALAVDNTLHVVTSHSFTVPGADCVDGGIITFALARLATDSHGGSLIIIDAEIQPVEV